MTDRQSQRQDQGTLTTDDFVRPGEHGADDTTHGTGTGYGTGSYETAAGTTTGYGTAGDDTADGTRTAYDTIETPSTDHTATDTVDADGTAHDPVLEHGHGETHAEDEAVYTDEAEVDGPRNTAEQLEPGASLFGADEVDGFRDEWRTLQGDFVDSPREAVHRADELVAQVIQSLATTFADHKRSLEGQWQEGEQVETEELRLALQRYRSFFDKLLSV